jgi:hypothetical protein
VQQRRSARGHSGHSFRKSERARDQQLLEMIAAEQCWRDRARRRGVGCWFSFEHCASSCFDSRGESWVNLQFCLLACLRVARDRFRTGHFENPSTFAAFHPAADLLQIAPFSQFSFRC